MHSEAVAQCPDSPELFQSCPRTNSDGIVPVGRFVTYHNRNNIRFASMKWSRHKRRFKKEPKENECVYGPERLDPAARARPHKPEIYSSRTDSPSSCFCLVCFSSLFFLDYRKNLKFFHLKNRIFTSREILSLIRTGPPGPGRAPRLSHEEFLLLGPS